VLKGTRFQGCCEAQGLQSTRVAAKLPGAAKHTGCGAKHRGCARGVLQSTWFEACFTQTCSEEMIQFHRLSFVELGRKHQLSNEKKP